MIDYTCNHKTITEHEGRFFCEKCDLEFDPPTPLCSCVIKEKNGVNICEKCGSVYDDLYLRKGVGVENSGEAYHD